MTTLPPGHRWREEEYTVPNAGRRFASYRDGAWHFRCADSDEWRKRVEFHYLCVPDADIERVWSLRAKPTEPIPEPPVERDARWHNVHRQVHHVWNVARGETGAEWFGLEETTNRIVRLLRQPMTDEQFNSEAEARGYAKHPAAISVDEEMDATRLVVYGSREAVERVLQMRKVFQHFDKEAERRGYKKFSMSLGVGDGTGQHFVWGDYDSIKLAQKKLLDPAPTLTMQDHVDALVGMGAKKRLARQLYGEETAFVVERNDESTRIWADKDPAENVHTVLILPPQTEGA